MAKEVTLNDAINEKHKFWYSSKFWITLFACVIFIFLGMQFLIEIIPPDVLPYLNFNLQLPLETVATAWIIVITGYCGADKLSSITKTTQLPYGQADFGDLSKMRFIMLVCLFLSFAALAASVFVDAEFQVAQFITSFSSVLLIYVGGNKIAKTCQFKDLRPTNSTSTNSTPKQETYREDEPAVM